MFIIFSEKYPRDLVENMFLNTYDCSSRDLPRAIFNRTFSLSEQAN